MNCSDALVYIVNEDINKKGYIGVKNKVLAQIHVLKKHFSKVFLAYYAYGIAYWSLDEEIIKKEPALSRKECLETFQRWVIEFSCKGVYMRCLIPASYVFIQFLKELHETNITVVMEYPTYPYEGEVRNENILREDRLYRDEIKKYVSLATTYSTNQIVHGIKTVALQNGVDINKNPIRRCKKKDRRIRMLAVANFGYHHGYERVLEGIYRYYKNPAEWELYFYLVGEGYEKRKYEQLVKNLGIQQYVDFCGVRVGRELDWFYDNSDIGISQLGFYKTGITTGTPIKTREYCSRGLPFIYGYEDDGFYGEEIWRKKIENSDEYLDMQEVILLYENTVEKKQIINDMRKYAEANFTWDNIFEEVVEYYKDNMR